MARVRSPAYPSLSLTTAVEMIRKVHNVQQSTPEPRDVVMRHMGYSSENGRALKAISALIKYGFLIPHGDSGLRVSDRAIAILYPEKEEDRELALMDAAMEPALFKDIFERWDKRPSEESLTAFLIRKGFNMNSVDKVARSFYETYDLVSGFGASYDSSDDERDELMERPSNNDDRDSVMDHKPQSAGLSGVRPTPEPESFLNVTNPVFDFESVVIQTKIDNQQDLDELLDRLSKIRGMLPNKSDL